MIEKYTIKIRRDPRSPHSIAKTSQIGTDALNALSIWSNMKKNRLYNLKAEDEEEVSVEIEWGDKDKAAGEQLVGCLLNNGLVVFGQ